MPVAVSACLIVKNDPHLERTISSVRPFVDEICIVDTGSTDGTAQVAEKLADRFEQFTGCNFEDGEIADFSAARTRSFALASYPTVLWCDSDDVVEGLQHLQEAIAWATAEAHGQPWRAKFAYDYDQDPAGQCISWQMRERIVHPKEAFHWVHRVHEGLTAMQPTEWKTLEPPQPIVWHHEIDRSKPRSRRNLRILRDHVQKIGPDNVDVKTTFDLGMEFAKAGDHTLALGWFHRYINQSDLDDDRAFACLHMVAIYSFWPSREQDAALMAHKATDIRPDWPEGYWALAKLAYSLANKTHDRQTEGRQLRRVVHFARTGLSKADTRTDVAVNPLDRKRNITAILQDALTRLGEHGQALDAMRVCASASPEDPAIQLRLRECELRVSASDALDVVIVCGITDEPWDPRSVETAGIGGSETAVIEMGKRLATMGCRVRVYCRCDNPGLYDGVEYRSMGQADEASGCDLLIAWRNATLLETTQARVKWLWVHDLVAIGATAWNMVLADRIVAVSEWHAEHLRTKYPASASRIHASRNGLSLDRFAGEAAPRNAHKAIFSSSPDRGLPQMLEMWSRIRSHVPDAELHIFYGLGNLMADLATEYAAKIESMANDGVILRGRVDQRTLAAEMLSAGVWVHPSWCGDKAFQETSCIGAMEAQAAGMRIVYAESGALPETVRHGSSVAGDARSDDFQQSFAQCVIRAMTENDAFSVSRQDIMGDAAAHFGWDAVASEWHTNVVRDVSTTAPIKKPMSRLVPRDTRPRLHMILAPNASGNVVMDVAGDPGGEAMGGGSRVGFLRLAEAMGALGSYCVRAFSTFKDPWIARGGVEYIRLDQMVQYRSPDVVLAYYDTSPLANFGPEVLRIASHHTYAPYMHFDSADVNTAPSDHAMRVLRERFDPTGQWYVLPNAVGAMTVHRQPVDGRILYHTSPDRGLHLLLAAYPAIKRAVPGASLHIVGGIQEILEKTPEKGKAGERTRAFHAAYEQAAACGGVALLGRLPRAEVWRELGEASVFAFPCAPTVACETFSISIMECCRIGLPVVLAPADALESIYAGHVRMTPAPAADHFDEFTDAVIDVLTSEREQARLAAVGRDLAVGFTFARAASELDTIIKAHTAEAPLSACAE